MLLITLKYTLFAVIATVLNILTQYSFLQIYQGRYKLYLAIFLGTGIGLLVKFILDKFYIFYDQSVDYRENARKFILYSIMGVITTLIFWGFELGFHAFFQHENAKFAGAGLGLAIGYLIKYRLDKKYVFKSFIK